MMLLVVLMTSLLLTPGQADQPVVTTQYGDLAGASRSLEDGRPYDVFMGIPYAAQPERFQPAGPVQPWPELRNATEFGLYCPQFLTPIYPIIGIAGRASEDCLHLNVYIPGGLDSIGETKLPVIVFFYGGAFLIGVSDMYPGEDLAVHAEVIVVTVNYRVGALGFLSTNDRNAPGNSGLWDDAAALKWVSENIAAFGGDPQRVTIMGQSAGGSSVSHLAISPQSRDYFQRMIGISGSSTAFFSLTKSALAMARNMGILFICPPIPNSALIRCLKEKSPLFLDLYGIAASVVLRGQLPDFIPSFDQDFVATEPRTAWEAGVPQDKDIMVGHVHDDGAGFLYLNFLGLPQGNLLNLARSKVILEAILKFCFNVYANPEELYDMVYQRYPDIMDDDLDTRTIAASGVLTDFVFGSKATLEAESHSEAGGTGSTYLYDYSHSQSFHYYKPWVNGSHIDDLYSIFGPVFMDTFRRIFLRRDFSEKDLAVSRNIQKYYGNFAHTGNPNEGPHKVDEFWPEFNNIDRQYMLMSGQMMSQKQTDDVIARYKFWNEDFDQASKPATVDDLMDRPDMIKFVESLRERVDDVARVVESAYDDPMAALQHLKNMVIDLIDP